MYFLSIFSYAKYVKKLIYVQSCFYNLGPWQLYFPPEMSTPPHPPSYYARRADFRICGSDPTIPGIHIGCGKLFQPENATIKVCTDCADLADRIVSNIESLKRNSQSQYGISGGPRKRRRFAYDALSDFLD